MEVGPYRVKKDGNLEYNPGSWDEFANIMFVDNPVGTGFSYVDQDSYLHDLPEMADQFVVFLEKYYALFPEYEHDDVSYTQIDTNNSNANEVSRYISPGSPMQGNIFLILRKPFSIAIKKARSTYGI